MKYFGFNATKILKYKYKIKFLYLLYYMKHCLPNHKLFKKTRKLRNTKNGKSVFVFGNGPSMKKLDPQKIKRYTSEDFEVIACNSFLYSDMGKAVKPDYMLFSDKLDFVDVPDDHPRAFRAKIGKPDKQKAIELGIPIFAPIKFCKYQKNGQCFFFDDYEDIFSNNVANILRPRGYGSWSGNKALSVAVYMGYSNIYICGLDYDMFKDIKVNNENKIYWEVKHFYDNEKRPSYVFERSKEYTIGTLLYKAHLNFIFLEKFKGYPITNLDPESYVDAFPKNHDLKIYKN